MNTHVHTFAHPALCTLLLTRYMYIDTRCMYINTRCMYIHTRYMYIDTRYMYVHTPTYILAPWCRRRLYVNVYLFPYIEICVHARTHAKTHTYTHTHIRTHVHMYRCTYMLCVYVHVNICPTIRSNILATHTYT
jgi:hypothetical protein